MPAVTNPHLKNNERSLWLHRAVLLKLLANRTGVTATARANLMSSRPLNPSSGPYFDAWEELLSGDLVSLVEALVSSDERFIALRQTSPFFGILSDDERKVVLDGFEAYWRSNYAD